MNGNHDELILEKISGIKEDIGELKTDIKSIKKTCACRLDGCSAKINEKISFKGFIATLTIFLLCVGVVIALAV